MKKILASTVILFAMFGPAYSEWTFDHKENGFDDSKGVTSVSAIAKDYGVSMFFMCADKHMEMRVVTQETFSLIKDPVASVPVRFRADKGDVLRADAELTSNTNDKLMLIVHDVSLAIMNQFADARNNISFGIGESNEQTWTFGAKGSSRIVEVADDCKAVLSAKDQAIADWNARLGKGQK
jgi:hypothetical protein